MLVVIINDPDTYGVDAVIGPFDSYEAADAYYMALDTGGSRSPLPDSWVTIEYLLRP